MIKYKGMRTYVPYLQVNMWQPCLEISLCQFQYAVSLHLLIKLGQVTQQAINTQKILAFCFLLSLRSGVGT